MKKSLALVLICLAIQPAFAQLHSASEGRIAYGHHHVNTSDPAAQTRFWVEGLGGELKTFGEADREIIAFPDVLVLLTERDPTWGTRGTVVNHVGFLTRDLRADVERLQSMGYEMITREELPPSYEVTDHVASGVFGNSLAFVLGPDDVKVELIEDTGIDYPKQMHHVHFAVKSGEAMRAWYAEHFGSSVSTRINQPAGDLPGVNLTFGPTADPTIPTRGTAMDHIGFEVDGLQALCEELKAKGIPLDMDYREIPSLGIAIAFLTDPWGTYIELTEGLDEI